MRDGGVSCAEETVPTFQSLQYDDAAAGLASSSDVLSRVNWGLRRELFETDIVLTPRQIRRLLSDAPNGRRRKRKIIAFPNYRWPRNNIQYRFTSSDAGWQGRIKSAIQLWEDRTCLSFFEQSSLARAERTRDVMSFIKGQGCFFHSRICSPFLEMYYHNRCYSLVGRVGGVQSVSIGTGCEHSAIVGHEIAHTLGLWHEQSRHDRDSFVRVNWGSIFRGAEGNFEKRNLFDSETFGVPYDLGSVMHYAGHSFGRSGAATLTPVDGNFARTMGQREGLSFTDIKVVNRAYCTNICDGVRDRFCYNGGYLNPRDCGGCLCPAGLRGDCTNADVSTHAICEGGNFLAQPHYQLIRSGPTLPNQHCYWMIRVLERKRMTLMNCSHFESRSGRRVMVQLESVDYETKATCTSYVEVKSGPELETTGPRFCALSRAVFWSANSTVVLIHRTDGAPGNRVGFVAKYIEEADPAPAEEAPSAPPEPAAGPWTDWGACTRSCGGCGRRERRRSCDTHCIRSGLRRRQFTSCGHASCPVLPIFSNSDTDLCGKTITLWIPCTTERQEMQRLNPKDTSLYIKGLPNNFPSNSELILRKFDTPTTSGTLAPTEAPSNVPVTESSARLTTDVIVGSTAAPAEATRSLGGAATGPDVATTTAPRPRNPGDWEIRVRRLTLRRRQADITRRRDLLDRGNRKLNRRRIKLFLVTADANMRRRTKRRVIKLIPFNQEPELCGAEFYVSCAEAKRESECCSGYSLNGSVCEEDTSEQRRRFFRNKLKRRRRLRRI